MSREDCQQQEPQLVSVQVKLLKTPEGGKGKKKKCLFFFFPVRLFIKLSAIDNSVYTILMALYFILVLPGILT